MIYVYIPESKKVPQKIPGKNPGLSSKEVRIAID